MILLGGFSFVGGWLCFYAAMLFSSFECDRCFAQACAALGDVFVKFLGFYLDYFAGS